MLAQLQPVTVKMHASSGLFGFGSGTPYKSFGLFCIFSDSGKITAIVQSMALMVQLKLRFDQA